MSNVGVHSADELDRLADRIDETVAELQTESSSVQRELGELGSSWRDASFFKFQSKYAESAEAIKEFIQEAEQFAAYLREHARLDRETEDYEV